MSKTSKMVFAAFMQHCIQSTVTHLTHVEDVEDANYYCTLYTGPLTPLGKAIYLKAFHLVGLAVHHQSCQTTRVIAGKTHNQSPILKTKGVLSNPVILRYLQQSCILHTLNKLPAQCNFDPKSVFNAWRTWACIIPLESAGSVSGKVSSNEQVDLPIHKLQH